MKSNYNENNLYLSDVLKLENSIDIMNKKLLIYFNKTYKKLNYADFLNSNDYYIQQIKVLIETLQNAKELDINKYGQSLQNFIISFDKQIILANENKMVKSSISNLRSFLIKSKQQLSLMNQLEAIQLKCNDFKDYFLLLEKLCVLLKSILELGDIKSNKKLNLYNLINKCLSEEKFMFERKVLQENNHIMSLNTEINYKMGVNFDIDDNNNKLFRSNSQNEECEDRNDKIIFDYLEMNDNKSVNVSPEEEEKLNLYMNHHPLKQKENKLLSNNCQSELTSNMDSNKGTEIKKTSNFMRNNSDDDESQKSNGMISQKIDFNFNQIFPTNLFYNFMSNHKNLRINKGDFYPMNEYHEDIFNINKTKVFSESKIKNEKIIVERKQTPEKIIKPENEILQGSLNKDALSNLTTPKNGQANVIKRTSNNLGTLGSFKKLYPIYSDEKSIIKVPHNYMAEDYDLKYLCDLINEPVDNKNWKQVMCEKVVTIYKKNIEGVPVILLKTIANLDGFTMEEVFEAISNVNIRKQWDKVFSEFKIVETNEEEQWEVLYMSIKTPSVFIQDRDFVQMRKIWKEFPTPDSVIIHFKSVQHKLCPEKKKFIRAETIISGYYIQAIKTNPPKTLVTIVSQTDIKGIIPTWIVNSVAQKAPKEWVNSLMKGCEKVRANKNNM